MSDQPEQAKSIFLDAIEQHGPDQWPAFLDQACAGNAVLRAGVEKLLRAQVEIGSFHEQPRPGDVSTFDRSVAEGAGAVIGPYKLLEQIGEGGFGVVFMAEQQRPIRRRVALKVLKPGMDTKQVVARFEAERQALAIMDHANIAKVHDGGTTDAGRPYFVMELVRGVPITEFCDQNHLTVRERLELFVPTCQAVQHAHQKGVIHRDLKPTNVLVTLHDGVAVPKVIDFGVAKAMGQQLTERTLFTSFAQMVGTPMYMSPEQAEMSGLDVDTRADIYALGVMLYELLTGTTPLDKQRLKENYDEIRRIIREEEPARPSSRVSTLGQAATTVSANRRTDPARLRRLVRGELDWIVMKCLDKDRNRRYESAAALAADVQRYLADEPVLACPPSAAYRFRKFARRNRGGVLTAAGAAFTLLLAVATALVVQAANTAEIKDRQQATKDALNREKDTNDELHRALEREQWRLYFQQVALAARELEAKNVGRGEELLEACPVELRGWEWHYLKRRVHQGPVALRGSGGWLSSVAFSPDGRYVAFAGLGGFGGLLGEITVWDQWTGRVHFTRSGHLGPIGGVAFSHDGKRLATAGWDKKVKVWDVATGKPLDDLPDQTEYVHCVAFSPDGGFLATAGGDRAVRVWDATTFQHLRALGGHTGGIYGIAFSPDGKFLASSSSDETVRVWETATGREVHTLRGHTGVILSVTFSRDGKRLASGGFDGIIKLWDAETGRHLRTIRDGVQPVMSVAFSRDGQRLAASGLEKVIRLWDVTADHEPQEVITLHGHADGVMGMAVSPDGLQIASASLDGTVKVWDSTPAAAGPELLTVRTGPVFEVAFRPSAGGVVNRAVLASANRDGLVQFWDAATGECTRTLRGHSGPTGRLVFSRDGKRLASVDYAGTTIVWDVEAGKELRTVRTWGGSVALDPDGARLAHVLEGGMVHILDVDTGREVIRPLRAHLAPILFVGFSPDGRKLVTASWDKTAKLWDAGTGRELQTFAGHSHLIQYVAFSGDGRRLATASWDKTAKVWDAATSKELLTLRGHEDRATGVAFSPDGKYLATSSQDNTVRVWDAGTGKEVAVLRGHTGYALSVAFSPDGKRLASSGGYRGQGEVKVWDATLWDKKPDKK